LTRKTSWQERNRDPIHRLPELVILQVVVGGQRGAGRGMAEKLGGDLDVNPAPELPMVLPSCFALKPLDPISEAKRSEKLGFLFAIKKDH
jgi:hypothetical protein